MIVDAFDAVGEAADRALESQPNNAVLRWRAAARAIRQWALEHPHDYALIYGSPVPGYRAPTSPVPRAVHADLARLRDAMAPGTPDEVLGRALLVGTALLGAISYELFGHLHGVIDSYDVFFEHQDAERAAYLASGPAARVH